jgi:uncharacterized membrane protein
MKWLIAYLAAGLAFGLLDFLWLRWAAPNLYRPLLGDQLAENFRMGPALVFYLIYVGAIVWFAVVPGMGMGVPLNVFGAVLPGVFAGVANAVLNGALLGLVCYATYDLTNQATLRHWPVSLTLIDIAWGMSATALASGVSAFALLKFGQA